MTTFVFANNVNTSLASAISASATTITLASSANLPNVPAGSYFPLTLNDKATGLVYEIVYVTAITGTLLTVIRGQEGTTAQSWLVGDYAYGAFTAASVLTNNPGYLLNPMTGLGQLIMGSNGGIPVALAAPTSAGQTLTSVASGASGYVWEAGSTAGTVTSISVVGTSGLTGSGTVTTSGTIDIGLDPTHANSWTGTQSLSGTSSTLAALVANAAEPVQTIAAAPAATQAVYASGGLITYFTTAASANWTVNLTFSAGTTLNTALAVGQAITFAVLTTQGTTGYYNSAVQVDGSSVTPYWQGGASPSIGNASGIDVYTYTVIKTGSGTFTVLASQTRF